MRRRARKRRRRTTETARSGHDREVGRTQRRARRQQRELDRGEIGSVAVGIVEERAAAARDDLERLRNKLSALSHTDVRANTADADAGCADVRGERDRLAALLAEGASLVAEGQQRGDELAVRLASFENLTIE